MTIEIERVPYPFNDDENSQIKGWVVNVDEMASFMNTPSAQAEGIWISVRDRETGEYVDPERFGLFIRFKKEPPAPVIPLPWINYGGAPPTTEEDDGWFDDFPPIPPGP